MCWHRTLSAIVAAVYVVGAFVQADPKTAFAALMFVSVPLGCIWFAEELGGYTGWASLHMVSVRTPGLLMRAVGWVMLAVPLLWVLLIVKA